MKRFFLNFIRNLVILVVALIVMYLIQPEIFGLVYQTMGALFGPVLIIAMILVTALPRGRRS